MIEAYLVGKILKQCTTNLFKSVSPEPISWITSLSTKCGEIERIVCFRQEKPFTFRFVNICRISFIHTCYKSVKNIRRCCYEDSYEIRRGTH